MKYEKLLRAIEKMSDEQLLFHLDNCEFFKVNNCMTPEIKLAYHLLTAEVILRGRRQ